MGDSVGNRLRRPCAERPDTGGESQHHPQREPVTGWGERSSQENPRVP
jgi:hypothetical protein